MTRTPTDIVNEFDAYMGAPLHELQPPVGRLWTLRELAVAVGITPDSLRQRIARKTLRATKYGRDWLVTNDDAQRAIHGSPPPPQETETCKR